MVTVLSRSATALACLAAAVALGVVVHSHTPSFDAAAVRGLHRALVHARLGVDLLKAVTALGALPWLLVVAAFAVWRLDRRSALVVVAALAAAVVVGNVGKLVVDRPRPVLVDPFAHGLSSSYPSGHTIQAAAVYGSLALLYGRRLLPAVLIALVGFSRVALGVHYPTDVFGGLLLGAAIVISIDAAVPRRTAPPTPPPPR